MKLKILAFDGEMLPTLAAMPDPEKSPIMLLSFTTNYEIMNGKRKVIFKLNRNKDELEGVQIRDFDVLVRFNDERRMTCGWELLIKDCDIIVGYNISGFDIPYIVDRAKALNMNKLKIGNADHFLYCKKTNSKGRSVTKIYNVQGKILEDVYYVLRRDDASNTIKADYTLKNLKLEVTAKEVLGKEKKEFSIQEMIDYWEKGINEEKFINYCSVDSELALEFITKFRLLDKFIGLSRRSGKLTQDIIDSQGFGGLVENLLMREFGKIGRVLPCRSKSFSNNDIIETEEDDLKGAYVLPPKLGISDNVVIADYESLYPTLIIKNNICYTTVITDNSIPDNPETMNIIKDEEGKLLGRFIKQHILKGIIPTILENLKIERKLAKTEMKKYEKGSADYLRLDSEQNATKILMNSFFGYTGEQSAKLYFYAIAASITGSGQKQIKYTMKMINDITVIDVDRKMYKLKIIQGDTDSVYVQVTPVDIKDKFIPSEILKNREICVRVVSKELEKINATLEKPMKLAFEDYAKRILITAKKRYTKIIVDEKGKEIISSKGIETQRRDWCNFSTESLDEAIKIILFESDVETGTKKMIDYIRDQAEKLRKNEIDIKKLILSKSLTKISAAYNNKSVHNQVAIKMAERGKPSNVGDRIQYLIMDTGNDKALISEKAEDADYVMEGKCKNKIDYDYYVSKQLFPPIERMLNVIGIDKNLLSKDKKQKTMMDF